VGPSASLNILISVTFDINFAFEFVSAHISGGESYEYKVYKSASPSL
jgi:hypothetical protein